MVLNPRNHRGAQPAGKRRGALEQGQRPAPGDQPEPYLQAARPVDAHPNGIGTHPLFHIPAEEVRVPLVASESVRLAEIEQPLVAIECPYHLAISDQLVVERIEVTPVNKWRAATRRRVQLPVHRIAEVECAVAQQIEATPAQGVCDGDNSAALRQGREHSRRGVGVGRALEKPAQDHSCARVAHPRRSSRRANRRDRSVDPFPGFLTAPHHHLGERHPQDALRPHTDGPHAPRSGAVSGARSRGATRRRRDSHRRIASCSCGVRTLSASAAAAYRTANVPAPIPSTASAVTPGVWPTRICRTSAVASPATAAATPSLATPRKAARSLHDMPRMWATLPASSTRSTSVTPTTTAAGATRSNRRTAIHRPASSTVTNPVRARTRNGRCSGHARKTASQAGNTMVSGTSVR